MAWKSSFPQKITGQHSRQQFPLPPLGISHVVADVEAPGGEKWERLKSGGKQWQATPKNLPRMQRTGAIPVVWLNSGLCPDRPKGWIPIIIIKVLSALNAKLLETPNCLTSYPPLQLRYQIQSGSPQWSRDLLTFSCWLSLEYFHFVCWKKYPPKQITEIDKLTHLSNPQNSAWNLVTCWDHPSVTP